MPNPRVNDSLVALEVELLDSGSSAVDLNSEAPTRLEVWLRPLDGDWEWRTGTIVNAPGTDGKIEYMTAVGDLFKSGTWQIYGRGIGMATLGTRKTNIGTFTVDP